MATDANEPKASALPDSEVMLDADSNSGSSDSDSDSGGSPAPQQVEWLATARAKRSTAGNRMKSMLANETPADEDSDLELLFQEDEDDEGFTDKDADDGSDVQMESSDDEDENAAQDDLEGEKELERQAKEKKAAARKRKAQEVIPAKFRKKVRISQPPDTPTSTTAPQHQPRPKKKSERASWLPSEADRPTRASERKTTRHSKEQLHQQMLEREARRKRQLEIMEKKAKRLEAMKKPPMTQAERLAEAAIVEKRNSKSLNRWEEAEKQREEERLAKLAALNNRRLEGPVVTFWTGIIDLSEVQLKHVGKMVSIEEKPKPKRKRPSTAVSLAVSTAESPAVSTAVSTAATSPKVTTESEARPATATTTAIASPKVESGPSGISQAPPTTQETPALPSAPETPREGEVPSAEPTSAIPTEAALSAPAPASAPSNPFTKVSTPPNLSTAPGPAPSAPNEPLIPHQPTPPSVSRPISPAVASNLDRTTATITTAVPPPISQPVSPANAPSPRTTTPVTTLAAPPPKPLSIPASSPGLAASIPSPITKTEAQAQEKKVPLALRPDVGPRFMPPPNPHLAHAAQSSVHAPPVIPGLLPGSMPVSNIAPTPFAPATVAPTSAAPTSVAPTSVAPTPVALTPVAPVPLPVNLDAPSLSKAPSPLNPPPAQTSSTSPPPTNPSPFTALTSPHPPPNPEPSAMHTTAMFQPILSTPAPAKTSKKSQTEPGTSKKTGTKSRKLPPPPEPEPEPEPPLEGKVTRSCIILQDFDEEAIKKPEVQTQILFGRKMSKLASKSELLLVPLVGIIANQMLQNLLILRYASSQITRHGTGIPRQGYLFITHMHTMRSRSSPKATSSGASCWEHGWAMALRPLRVFRTGFFVQRLKRNGKKGLSAKHRRKSWPRRTQRRRGPKKLRRHLLRSKKRRLPLFQRLRLIQASLRCLRRLLLPHNHLHHLGRHWWWHRLQLQLQLRLWLQLHLQFSHHQI